MPLTAISRRFALSCACLTVLWIAIAGTAQAQPAAQSPLEPGGLRAHDALLTLEYQSIRVAGDRPIDLAGFHAYRQVLDGLYFGVGFFAPLFKGDYGGFVAADVGLHARRRLTGPVVGLAGVGLGGGGGGRSISQSRILSGSGGFARAYLGLGYDFGNFTVGTTVSRLKFRNAAIDGTQANLFVEIPFRYLTGPYGSHGQPVPTVDDRRAAREMSENMLTLGLDNYQQVDPTGANKQTIRLVDLQYAHFFARDTYWFASIGMAYAGLPLYNQLLGGVGQRVRLTNDTSLYGQVGLGSGGYAPAEIDTGSGLLVYPKLSVEHALTRDLALAFTVGYMAAPKGSSRNRTYGLALVHHLRSGQGDEEWRSARYQGLRASLFHETNFQVRYREIKRSPLQMLGLQLDIPVGQRSYLAMQAAAAHNAYLGYPGYAEIFGGLGVQTLSEPGDRVQAFGQVLGGANVHGRAAKVNAGVRFILDDRLALNLTAGHTEARNSGGARFSASNFAAGLDYRFSVPTR